MSYHDKIRKEARAAIDKHFTDAMDEETKTLLSHCTTDLHYGPDAVEEGYAGYSSSLKKLEEWSQENICEVWYLTDCGILCESEPSTEDDEEGYGMQPEDAIHYERHEVARIIFGKLISDGSMNA